MMDVLQFSGGIDSLACLHQMHDMEGLCVVTVSTDGAYPERADYLARVRAAFPRTQFHHVETQRRLDLFGRPVDVVPLRWTSLGALVRGNQDVRYQDTFSCCNRAIWAPMHDACAALGATDIWRGQRDDETMTSPLRDGACIDGITYHFPLHDWTRDRVLSYLGEHLPDLIPASYKAGEATSRDCMDCTGYLFENGARINNLPSDEKRQVQRIIGQWRADVAAETGEFTWT